MDFEDLRVLDLVKKFKTDIEDIYTTRSIKKFATASTDAQNIYNFLLTSKNPFEEAQEYFKNLFSSFNYAAVIINNALKEGKLSKEDTTLLNECLEILLKCCEKIDEILNK